jgi:hypothetical protein
MSGMTVTGAIVLPLGAITIWVFAGGKGGDPATTTTPAPTGSAACATAGGSNCVQAARNLVNGLNTQSSAQPPASGYSNAP